MLTEHALSNQSLDGIDVLCVFPFLPGAFASLALLTVIIIAQFRNCTASEIVTKIQLSNCAPYTIA